MDEGKALVLGYTTRDLCDENGKLLLAAGIPVTEDVLRNLEKRKVRFVLSDKLLSRYIAHPEPCRNPFAIPEKLDKKFAKLDIESVGNASRHLNHLLKEAHEDLFLSNNIKAFSQRYRALYSHSINVAIISRAIAQKMKLDNRSLYNVTLGALLHDLGKMLLPPAVSANCAPPDEERRLIYQQHPRLGADILAAEKFPAGIWLTLYQHHEKYRGGGYPNGSKGSEIHLNAHVVSVADAFDRSTSSIFKREILSPEEAVEHIILGKDTDYHPAVVDHFVGLFRLK